ncbi:MAG: hypothetical protein ABEI54_01105 [Candidatus Bipolaricaulia bacterium]
MKPIQRCSNCQYFVRLEDGVACMAFHEISGLGAEAWTAENACPDFEGRVLELDFPIKNRVPWHAGLVGEKGQFDLARKVAEEQARQNMERYLEAMKDYLALGYYIEETTRNADGSIRTTVALPSPAERVEISTNQSNRDRIAGVYAGVDKGDSDGDTVSATIAFGPSYQVRRFGTPHLICSDSDSVPLDIWRFHNITENGSVYGESVNQASEEDRQEAIRHNLQFFEDYRNRFEANGMSIEWH